MEEAASLESFTSFHHIRVTARTTQICVPDHIFKTEKKINTSLRIFFICFSKKNLRTNHYFSYSVMYPHSIAQITLKLGAADIYFISEKLWF
jgi:hypothetical protein